MTVVLRSIDVGAPKGEFHDATTRMTKALVSQSGVSRHGASTFVRKEGSELTVNGLQMKQVVVHDEDEVAMSVTGCRLSDNRVMEANVVPFPEMLMGNDAWVLRLDMLGACAARMRIRREWPS
jgi:hypothetical protein